MKLVDADLGGILYVARNMRAQDRDEIFATRWDDNPDVLAGDVFRTWGQTQVVAYADDGLPAAVMGVTPLWPGVWGPWLFATDQFPKVGKALTRWAKRELIPMMLQQGMHRAECRSLATHTAAHAWMEALGAKRESVLRQYGRDKQDFILFAWEF